MILPVIEGLCDGSKLKDLTLFVTASVTSNVYNMTACARKWTEQGLRFQVSSLMEG